MVCDAKQKEQLGASCQDVYELLAVPSRGHFPSKCLCWFHLDTELSIISSKKEIFEKEICVTELFFPPKPNNHLTTSQIYLVTLRRRLAPHIALD